MPGGWAELLQVLIERILQQLILPDYIRFGAVCVSWRAEIVKRNCSPKPQLPWLMLSPQQGSDTTEFLSPCEARTYRIKFPKHGHCWGAYEGWLMIETANNPSHNFLFNPLSDDQITIPSLSTLPYSEKNQRNSIIMATFSSIRTVMRAIVVACIYADGKLALCKPGDKEWRIAGDERIRYLAITFCHAKLYALDDRLRLWLAMDNGKTDILRRFDEIKVPMGSRPEQFLLNSNVYLVKHERKLLLVSGTWSEDVVDTGIHRMSKGFDVFELDLKLGRWDVVENLSEYMLFLGTGFAKSTRINTTSGALADRIVFIDEMFKFENGLINISSPTGTLHQYDHLNRTTEPYILEKGPLELRPFHYPYVWLVPDPWQRIRPSIFSSMAPVEASQSFISLFLSHLCFICKE